MVSISPVLDTTWVSAMSTIVAVRIAEHDVPSAMGVMAVGSERIEVENSDVRVIFLLGELQEPVVDVTRVTLVRMIPGAVVNGSHVGGAADGGFNARVFRWVVNLSILSALILLGSEGTDLFGGLDNGLDIFGHLGDTALNFIINGLVLCVHLGGDSCQ